MVVIAATTTVMIGICIATIVYVLIQLLEAPPQPPQPQPLLQHPVKTFGKQRNAKRWRRKEDVKNPKLRPIAKRLVEFARHQDDFFKLYLIK